LLLAPRTKASRIAHQVRTNNEEAPRRYIYMPHRPLPIYINIYRKDRHREYVHTHEASTVALFLTRFENLRDS
jgi:hypothetical protein